MMKEQVTQALNIVDSFIEVGTDLGASRNNALHIMGSRHDCR